MDDIHRNYNNCVVTFLIFHKLNDLFLIANWHVYLYSLIRNLVIEAMTRKTIIGKWRMQYVMLKGILYLNLSKSYGMTYNYCMILASIYISELPDKWMSRDGTL